MPKAAADKQSSRTATRYETGPSVSATPSISIGVSITKPGSPQRSNKAIEAAVYSYIQALRSLGKTQVNTAEIARALGLPVSNVDSVVPKLNEKGIKLAG